MENDSEKYPLILFLTKGQLAILAKLTVLARSIPEGGGVVLPLSSQLVVRQAGLAISEGLENNVARERE